MNAAALHNGPHTIVVWKDGTYRVTPVLDLPITRQEAGEILVEIPLATAPNPSSATPIPGAASGQTGEDLSAELTRIRDKFLIPTPDKDHTDYAIMTRCIAALTAPEAKPEPSDAAKLIAYEDAHDVAVEMGFPSLTEALEELSRLKEAKPEPEGERKIEWVNDARNVNDRRLYVDGAQWAKVYGRDERSLNARCDIIEAALSAPAQSDTEKMRALEDAAREFVRRVDAGEIRSKRSYAAFKAALGAAKK